MDEENINAYLTDLESQGTDSQIGHPALRFTPPNVKAIRLLTGLSQSRFAAIIGVHVKTLQNWEQGRTQPRRAVATLLKIIESDPLHAIQRLQGGAAP